MGCEWTAVRRPWLQDQGWMAAEEFSFVRPSKIVGRTVNKKKQIAGRQRQDVRIRRKGDFERGRDRQPRVRRRRRRPRKGSVKGVWRKPGWGKKINTRPYRGYETGATAERSRK